MMRAYGLKQSALDRLRRVSAILVGAAFIVVASVAARAQNNAAASSQPVAQGSGGKNRPVYAHLCTWTKEFSGRWTMWKSDYADALH